MREARRIQCIRRIPQQFHPNTKDTTEANTNTAADANPNPNPNPKQTQNFHQQLCPSHTSASKFTHPRWNTGTSRFRRPRPRAAVVQVLRGGEVGARDERGVVRVDVRSLDRDERRCVFGRGPEALAEELGASVLIRNVGGAAGTVGAAEVARAKPDGTTLLLTSMSPIAIQPSFRPSVPYRVSSFAPVCLVADAPAAMILRDRNLTTPDDDAYVHQGCER